MVNFPRKYILEKMGNMGPILAKIVEPLDLFEML